MVVLEGEVVSDKRGTPARCLWPEGDPNIPPRSLRASPFSVPASPKYSKGPRTEVALQYHFHGHVRGADAMG